MKHKQGLGKRAPGAGRKDLCSQEKQKVKIWLKAERSYGHVVQKQDLYDQFLQELSLDIDACKRLLLQQPENAQLTCRIALKESRVQKWLSSRKYADTVKDDLLRFCQARLLKPQRVSTLTMQEEKVRTELTLQNFDH